jgi:hypothetical protein
MIDIDEQLRFSCETRINDWQRRYEKLQEQKRAEDSAIIGAIQSTDFDGTTIDVGGLTVVQAVEKLIAKAKELQDMVDWDTNLAWERSERD